MKTNEITPLEAWKAAHPGVKVTKLEIIDKPARYDKETGEEIEPAKKIVGYFEDANRHVVGSVLAIQLRDPIQGAKIWIDSCLIQELSDPRFLQDDKDILLTCVPYSQSIAEQKKSSMTTV